MSTRASRFVVPALACLALLTPGIASGGVQIGIGFGTTFGPHFHHHHGYGAYVYAPLWPHYYSYDPWYDPWYYPAPVVVSPPVVRPHITVTEHKPAPPKQPDLVAEKLQQKKSESFKKLRIGDPSQPSPGRQGPGAVRARHPDQDRPGAGPALGSRPAGPQGRRRVVQPPAGQEHPEGPEAGQLQRLRPRRPPGRLQSPHHDGRILREVRLLMVDF